MDGRDRDGTGKEEEDVEVGGDVATTTKSTTSSSTGDPAAAVLCFNLAGFSVRLRHVCHRVPHYWPRQPTHTLLLLLLLLLLLMFLRAWPTSV